MAALRGGAHMNDRLRLNPVALGPTPPFSVLPVPVLWSTAASTRLRSHRSALLYGLEGVLTVIVDGQTREIRAGDAIFIPRGAVHHHENLHDGTAKVLATITPGTIGRRYFEEIAEVVNVPGKPDLAKANEIMLRHGLVPV